MKLIWKLFVWFIRNHLLKGEAKTRHFHRDRTQIEILSILYRHWKTSCQSKCVSYLFCTKQRSKNDPPLAGHRNKPGQNSTHWDTSTLHCHSVARKLCRYNVFFTQTSNTPPLQWATFSFIKRLKHFAFWMRTGIPCYKISLRLENKSHDRSYLLKRTWALDYAHNFQLGTITKRYIRCNYISIRVWDENWS